MNTLSGQTETLAPTMTPIYLTYIRRFLQRCGADEHTLSKQTGLSLDAEIAGKRKWCISQASIAKTCELASIQVEDPYFGLHLAQSVGFETPTTLVSAMLTAQNVEAALHTLVHYESHLDTGIKVNMKLTPVDTLLSVEIARTDDGDYEQLCEFFLALIHHILTAATCKPMPLKRVQFQHITSKPHDLVNDFFSAPVDYGADKNCLVLDNRYLKERHIGANSPLHAMFISALQTLIQARHNPVSYAERVYLEVIHQFKKSAANIDAVAKNLAMSPRSLKRALHKEGTSFRRIKNRAIGEQAKFNLANTQLSVKQIADLMGYSDSSTFIRAFREICNETPDAYRKRAPASPLAEMAQSDHQGAHNADLFSELFADNRLSAI